MKKQKDIFNAAHYPAPFKKIIRVLGPYFHLEDEHGQIPKDDCDIYHVRTRDGTRFAIYDLLVAKLAISQKLGEKEEIETLNKWGVSHINEKMLEKLRSNGFSI